MVIAERQDFLGGKKERSNDFSFYLVCRNICERLESFVEKNYKNGKNTAGDVKYFYSDLEISALVVEWL